MAEITEECGIFAALSLSGTEDVVPFVYNGLFSLQHRGQEAAGVALLNDGKIDVYKGLGLVSHALSDIEEKAPSSSMALGHVRCKSSGERSVVSVQPFVGHTAHGDIAIANNGNLVNSRALREELYQRGTLLQTRTDSELLLAMIARNSLLNMQNAISHAVSQAIGAYSLVLMDNKSFYAVRDPLGMKPLCVGRLGDIIMISSESCAFENCGAELLFEIEPGEIVTVDSSGVTRKKPVSIEDPALCCFEYIYLSRPDSILNGKNVHQVRKALGKELGKEKPIDADLVMAAPESGNSAAIGVAEELGLPFDIGLVKNRYVGRTFIRPDQKIRQNALRLKMTPISGVLKDKRIVLVDDSIVRGNTSRKTVQLLREGGAKEIYVYIASPPFRYPCYYGLDATKAEELIANKLTKDELCKTIGADRLEFLSIEGLYKAIGVSAQEVCSACFSGVYPTILDK